MSFEAASIARLRSGYPDMAVRAHRMEQDVRKVTGMQIRIVEMIRTVGYQAELYAKGREQQADGSWTVSNKGAIVTNSRPGESIHHYGLAFDVCFVGQDPYLEALRKRDAKEFDRIWRAIGSCGQGNGLTWGYDWNGNGIADANDFDRPHFQKTYDYRLQEIREFYNHGGMAAVWAAMDKAREVPQGSEWDGPATRQKLLEIGILV